MIEFRGDSFQELGKIFHLNNSIYDSENSRNIKIKDIDYQ